MQNQTSQYTEDLAPLYDIIETLFKERISNSLDHLIKHKYKETFLINETSKEEFNQLIKDNTHTIISFLSKSYIKYKLNKYYSNDGLIFLIMTTLSVKSKLYCAELMG